MTEREKEREKLIELLEEADQVAQAKGITDYKDAIADNADHLLANGVIVPPIGVGQTLWYIDEYSQTVKSDTVKFLTVTKSDVKPILRYHNVRFWEMHQWGKTVFLTKSQAEEALKK